MPAFESRRVRTQPLTVTGASCGAWPARIPRTLKSRLSIDREYSGRAACPAIRRSDETARRSQRARRRAQFRCDARSVRRFGTRTAGSGRSHAIISFPRIKARTANEKRSIRSARVAQGRSHDAHRTRRSGLLVTAFSRLPHRPTAGRRRRRRSSSGARRSSTASPTRRCAIASLLIEGNTIREVLPADAAAPAGAQVLDLSGKFIIPGLFDSHVHWEDYMGELFVNHGVTSIVALENAPKALRAQQPGRPRPSAVLPPRRPAAALQRHRGGRHPPDGADLARERTRFRVVRAIQRPEFPRLCDRSRRSPQSRLHHLRPYRQRARLGARRHGHHRAYLGLRRSRHVAGATGCVQGRQIPDLGDFPDRLEQARCNDRGRGAPRRLPQSHAALRMGRHEPARLAAGTGGLSRPEQSGPLLYPTQCRRRHPRPATADQELFFALREYAVDQPPVGGRSQGIRGRIPERARVHQKICRGGRQDSRRHGYDRGRNAGPRHASRDGDAGRGRPHADAGAESGDLMAGRIAAGQERKRAARRKSAPSDPAILPISSW